MPAINWTFLCDYAYVDANGRASIIRTFTFIRGPRLPFRYPQMFLAMEYMADMSESFTIGAAISAPSGKQVARVQLKKDSQGDRVGQVHKGVLPLGFYNVRFEEEGEHHVEIFINEQAVHFLPLMIHTTPNSPPMEEKPSS
jgi:hypothetical protein